MQTVLIGSAPTTYTWVVGTGRAHENVSRFGSAYPFDVRESAAKLCLSPRLFEVFGNESHARLCINRRDVFARNEQYASYDEQHFFKMNNFSLELDHQF